MPYHEPLTATLVGLTTGLGSAAVQASVNVAPNPFLVPIVSAAVGGLMSFAVLKSTVRVVERDLGDIKKKVDTIGERVARIEGRLGVDE